MDKENKKWREKDRVRSFATVKDLSRYICTFLYYGKGCK